MWAGYPEGVLSLKPGVAFGNPLLPRRPHPRFQRPQPRLEAFGVGFGGGGAGFQGVNLSALGVDELLLVLNGLHQ